MNFLRAKTPWLVKKAFPDYVWNFQPKEKVIYLTFDDGPTPIITQETLSILKQYDAKATFFCIGKNIKENPSIFSQIIDEGHAIGNHTYNHLKGWKSITKDYVENTLKAESAIEQISKSVNKQKLFRPPYGRIKPSQAKQLQQLGYTIIMWDVLSIDWDNSQAQEKVLKNVLEDTQPGSIVVFHDSEKAAKNMSYALPRVLDYFSKKGYAFKKIAI